MIQKYLRFCFLVVLLLALSTTPSAATNLRSRSLEQSRNTFFDTIGKWATSIWSFLDIGEEAEEEPAEEAPEQENIMRDTASPSTSSPTGTTSTFSPTSDATFSSSMDGSGSSTMDATSSSTLGATSAST